MRVINSGARDRSHCHIYSPQGLRAHAVYFFLLLSLFANSTTSFALQIAESYSPTRVIVGGKLTYTYTLLNDGAADESGTLFTNRFPLNSVFSSALITNGAFSVSNNVLSYRPEDLGPGAKVVVQLIVTIVTAQTATNMGCWVGSAGDVAFMGSGVPVVSALSGPKMATGRNDHTSTLLKDGRVLIVGGLTFQGVGVGATETAEVYNPADDSFDYVGSMNTPRQDHTATLLTNGMVLVAGGGTSTVELFDPGTSVFSVIANLTEARNLHTATLLPNGDLILAGGAETNTLIERLTCTNGQWLALPAGHLVVPRSGHLATLLPNGAIVFAGGMVDANAFVETFNPEAGLSALVASAGSGIPVAAVSRGKVLLHGYPNASVTGTEVYDIEANTFTPVEPVPTRYSGSHYLTMSNGEVLITAGYYSFEVRNFNPRVGSFTSSPALATTRSHHSGVELADGRILLTGGYDFDGITSSDMRSTELYVLRLDSDQDGMDDPWELANGFDPARREDALEDADGDGHSNLQEFLAGTGPRDPFNVLKIEPPRIVDNSMRIRFPTVLGKYYRVERTVTQQAEAWEIVSAEVAGDGRTVEIRDPMLPGATQRMYRVVLLP